MKRSHLFIIASLLFIPRMLLHAYKMQFISKKQKMNFSLLYLSKIFLISLGFLVKMVFPGMIGGVVSFTENN